MTTNYTEYRTKNTFEGKQWEILGPFDSGTNLMEQTIKSNFPTAWKSGEYLAKLWKHGNDHGNASNIYASAKHLIGYNVSDIVAVALIRSPLAQVMAWKKAPYYLKPCVNRPQTDYGKPCSPALGATIWDPTIHKCMSDVYVKFGSVMDVYNSYVKLYKSIVEEKRFSAVLIVTFEELVYDAPSVVRRLGPLLGLEALAEPVVFTSPAKKHGKAKGRVEQLKSLEDRPWLRAFSNETLMTLCCLLDIPALGNLSDPSGRTYAKDCEVILGNWPCARCFCDALDGTS